MPERNFAEAKLIRNIVQHPTWEAEITMAFCSLTTIPISAAIAELGIPEVGLVVYSGTLGFLGYQLVRNRMRERQVSNFFRVMKVKTTEGILAGLVNIGKKVKENDPWFCDFKAFKGTSWIVNPRIAGRFGFEVGEPEGRRFFTVDLRKVDKAISFVPEMAPMTEIHTAWISRERLLQIHNSGIVQDSLDAVKRGLKRRK